MKSQTLSLNADISDPALVTFESPKKVTPQVQQIKNQIKVYKRASDPVHVPVVIRNADLLGPQINPRQTKNETVRGPPGFRPKSGGKLVVGQGRSQAFRPSQIHSKNLRQPQSQIKVDGTQIRDSTSLEQLKSMEQLKHKIQIDLNGQQLKSNGATLTINQSNDSSNKQTFFSRVMNETFGIISTKKISHKASQDSIDPLDLINLRAIYYGSPNKKKSQQGTSAQVKIEQQFSLDQQMEMLHTFLLENQGQTPIESPDLLNSGILPDSLLGYSQIVQGAKEVILEKMPEKLMQLQAPQLKKNSKSLSRVRTKWDRKSNIIQSRQNQGLMIDSTRQQPDMLIRTNDSQSQIAFQTNQIEDITNLELKNGVTFSNANLTFRNQQESVRYKKLQKATKKQLKVREFGATKLGQRSLKATGNYFIDPDIEDRVETLETVTGGRSARNQKVNSDQKLKMQIMSKSGRRTIEESAKSIQTRENSDQQSQFITPNLTKAGMHRQMAGGSFFTNAENSKTYLGYEAPDKRTTVQNINKKAFAFFKTFDEHAVNPRSENNRSYIKTKPSILTVSALTRNIKPDVVPIRQYDHKRLNSAEGLMRQPEQEQFECYNDVKDGRLSVKSFLKLSNKQYKHMSDSESALAVCLKMQQRGQVPIKALTDMTIFKKKNWKDDKKARVQREVSKGSISANQAFVRSLYSNLGPSFIIDRKLPAKRPSTTLDNPEPNFRDTMSTLNNCIVEQKEAYADTPLSEFHTTKETRFPKSANMLKSVDATHNINELLETLERPVQSAIAQRHEDMFVNVSLDIEKKKEQIANEVQATPVDLRRYQISQVNQMISQLKQDLDELDKQKKQQMRLVIGLDEDPKLSQTQNSSQLSQSKVGQSQSSVESCKKLIVKPDENQLAAESVLQSIKTVSNEGQIGQKAKKKPKTASEFKAEILNSFEYRVAKKVPTDISKSCLPEFLNEHIEEMCKDNKTDRKGAISDPFFIVKKPQKSRSLNQQKVVAQFLKTLCFKFSTMQIEELIYVVKKLIPELFLAGQSIVDTWKPGQKVLTIIVSGSVTVKPPGFPEYQTKGPFMLSESAFEEVEPKVEFSCISTCKVLFLYLDDFASAKYQYLQEKRRQALLLLSRVPVLQKWNMLRKSVLSDTTYYMTQKAGSIIYNLGEKVNNVYFIREGIVQLEIFFEVKHFSCAQYPYDKNLYQRITTTQLVKKVIKIVNAGEMFGHEEIITSHPIRVVRAKSLRPVVIFACSKHDFLSKIDRTDVRQLIDQCKQYTDFEKCGVELANQMKQLRRKTDCLLAATQSNGQYLQQKNFRSQDTLYTWLGLSAFGTKPQKRVKLMQKYLSGVKERAQTLVLGDLRAVKENEVEVKDNDDLSIIKEVGENLVKQLISTMRVFALQKKETVKVEPKPKDKDELKPIEKHPQLDENINFGFKIISVKSFTDEFEEQAMRSIWQQREQLVKERKQQLREKNNHLNVRRNSRALEKEMQTQEDDILYERKNSYLHSMPCVEEMNLVVMHTLKLTLE